MHLGVAHEKEREQTIRAVHLQGLLKISSSEEPEPTHRPGLASPASV